VTNQEIMCRAIAEAAGVQVQSVRTLIKELRPLLPPNHKLDQDRPRAEAKRLLAGFRTNPEPILVWLRKGYLDAIAKGLPPLPLTVSQTP